MAVADLVAAVESVSVAVSVVAVVVGTVVVGTVVVGFFYVLDCV